VLLPGTVVTKGHQPNVPAREGDDTFSRFSFVGTLALLVRS
jgi:hypothetical protein